MAALAALVAALCLGVAHCATTRLEAATEAVAEAVRKEDQASRPTTSLLRRWRLDVPLEPAWASRTSSRTPSRTSSSSAEEELEDIQHYPARRSLHWLPSGLGTHWDLHGENSHPVRHGRHHRGKHHRGTTEAPDDQRQQPPSEEPPTTTTMTTTTTSTARPPPPPAVQQPNKTVERFVPLALSADFASRGAVADVVVDRESATPPRPRDHADDASIHVRPAMDDTCYSSNQVLIIIAMTCMLSLGFIALVMGCVHCCTANVKAKEYETFDTPFLQLDHCDLGPRSPRAAATRHKEDAGWLRKLHYPPRDADHAHDSEEELLFHAPSRPVDSPSLISLHSLQAARERGSSMSMEDLLLLGRCR